MPLFFPPFSNMTYNVVVFQVFRKSNPVLMLFIGSTLASVTIPYTSFCVRRSNWLRNNASYNPALFSSHIIVIASTFSIAA